MFWVLAISLIIFNLIDDILELIANILNSVFLLGTILDFTFNFVIDPIVSLLTFLILMIMGEGLDYWSLVKKAIPYIIGVIAEEVPWLDALPLRTITLIITIYLIYRDIRTERTLKEELIKEQRIEKSEIERIEIERLKVKELKTEREETIEESEKLYQSG